MQPAARVYGVIWIRYATARASHCLREQRPRRLPVMSRRLLALAAAAGAAPATVVSQGGLISNFGCGGFAEFQARLDTVEVACCGDEDCPTGVPAACSVNCALVFSPFYEACGVLIGRMLDDDAAGTAQ
eukprot:COSAG06_NODE_15986_length_1031_cov_0.589056_1_plen_128_part_10